MTPSEDLISFDLEKVRFDLSLPEAFALTSVRSLDEYLRLKENLPYLRGQSYFFVNILGQRAKLFLTIIIAEEQEITATKELDTATLGISHEELLSAGGEDGNHPVPPHTAEKIRLATRRAGRTADFGFFRKT